MVFYKTCWNVIKEDLLRVFHEFHSNSKLAKGCNPSFIALIPKKEEARTLSGFRPISLIGSLYKILAKVLASRLKSVLGKLIGDTQSAYLHGRFILDSVVALNEAIEDARNSKTKRLILKVDFAKAFDSISWDYLLDIKKKMNFPDKWIAWIHTCLSSAKANVLVNGSPSDEFDLQRGVRQGDPLSPFLFLIAAEGLNLLIKKAIGKNLLQPCQIGRNKVILSHLQYADDTIFVLEGTPGNVSAIRMLLMNFELISGLSVNFDKCWIYGINTDRSETFELARNYGCRVGTFPISYLGLKVGGRAYSSQDWDDIILKMKSKLRKWDVSNLSMAGRITLIRSVLSAIPIYSLSLYPLPKKISNSMRSVLCDFLWGNKDGGKKIAWIKWDDLCLPKNEGGLGFLHLTSFNKALLSKWIWRFLSSEESLWKKIIVSRHGLPFWAKNDHSSSSTTSSTGWWKKILRLVEGDSGKWFWDLVHRQLGDGKDTDFWEGAWTSSSSLKSRFPRLIHLSTNREAKVSDMGYWNQGIWNWKLEWRRDLRCSELSMVSDLLEVISAFSPTEGTPDMWIWSGKGDGFSVRKVYLHLESFRRSPTGLQAAKSKMIWKSTATFKAQVHGWRLLRNRLPTLDNLRKRIDNPGMNPLCCYCRQKEESSRHLFFECDEVLIIWNNLTAWIGVSWAAPFSSEDHFHSFSFLLGGDRRTKNLSGLWVCTVWVWWKHRNAIIFDNGKWDSRRILEEIKCRFWNWCFAKGEVNSYFTFEQWTTQSLAELWHSV